MKHRDVIVMDQDLISTEEARETSITELLQKLGSKGKGLSDSEAKERLQRYGYNEITEKKVHPLVKFMSYFWGPIAWMIEVAAILSATIHHWEDFWIIFVLLLVNAVVAFWQEYKADNAIELLKQRLAPNARVLRDDNWLQVPARELVPGDVVRVRLGDIVPADIKLMDGDYLLVDESALTGESLPVEKHGLDVSYDGSVIRQGEMNALVAATGMNTYFGKTAKLVAETKTRSHFQKAVLKIGDYLIFLGIGLVTVIFFVALFRHESFLEILQFALVLIVASIPVALPAVLSVTMAVGAIALSKKEAIVSKLLSIEEMAGMDCLCSDKTGTITKNELTVANLVPFEGFTGNDVLLFGTLASREEDRDPIDTAIITKTKSVESLAEVIGSLKISGFKPFDPVAKRTEAAVEDADGNRFRVTKGAPQVILELAANQEAVKSDLEKHVNALAAKGYRALGVARTDVKGAWQFVGLIPLYDPPREDSAETVKTAQSMGVNVKMVTGDHAAIAREIAQEVNLGTNMMPASSFLDKSGREARRIVEKADGFAQVFPEHKYHIVELLQQKGHIIGMTGDGVNDAPALKKADVGIAVAGATDAAKSAADIVLTKPGLSVIIDAIKESRKIFQRMNHYAIYRIAETIRVLMFMTLSIIVFNFYPVTAIMIVLLALLNDLPIMTISFDNVRYSNEPEQWKMSVLLGVATSLGLFGVLSSFGIFYIGEEILHLSREALQSFIYLKLSVAGHMTLFVARTRGPFWSTKPAKPLFLALLSTQIIATLIVVYGIILPPIGWKLALFVWGYALAWFVLNDLV
ncbi:MAG: plasma-membrane proton-efflux P-type ATPase, partial [Bacteroidota bacterium]